MRLIRDSDVVKAIDEHTFDTVNGLCLDDDITCILEKVPGVQPTMKSIGYAECANAMLRMWLDNVVTDGEYHKIMDKLNTHWSK